MPGYADATVPLVLLVSYSGSFGGAERLLLEFAGGLPGETVRRLPAGSAGRRRTRPPACGCSRSARGPLQLRGGVRAGDRRDRRARPDTGSRSARWFAASTRSLVIAWGMRSALACLLPRVHAGAGRVPAQRPASRRARGLGRARRGAPG